ncbi:DUF805 domain-containing protein [Candidatus Pelagibacter sp.]|nr:DUF805 domain-containing protein [Candidatus Pelagibacter sp.]
MTLGESISTCFKKYFVMQGRASKSEFWWFQLIWSSCFILSFIFESETVSYFLFGIIIMIFIPLFTVGVRRLHDTGRSGFHYLWSAVPFIGSLIVLALMLADGTKGRNQYGDNPLKKTTKKKKRKN